LFAANHFSKPIVLEMYSKAQTLNKLMEGLEENEASQEANYMAESESEVGEANVEIEAHIAFLQF
jgi:hypothetical protein